MLELTVFGRAVVSNGALVDGRVDEEILAEVLEVAVYTRAALHGCNENRPP